jgi:hypothetical protein
MAKGIIGRAVEHWFLYGTKREAVFVWMSRRRRLYGIRMGGRLIRNDAVQSQSFIAGDFHFMSDRSASGNPHPLFYFTTNFRPFRI